MKPTSIPLIPPVTIHIDKKKSSPEEKQYRGDYTTSEALTPNQVTTLANFVEKHMGESVVGVTLEPGRYPKGSTRQQDMDFSPSYFEPGGDLNGISFTRTIELIG